MSAAVSLLGVAAFLGGAFIIANSPSDIQIGIGATCMMGGLILEVLALVIGKLNKLTRSLAQTNL